MTMHTGASLRVALVDALRASGDLVDVQIETAFPGDRVKAEALYCGEVVSSPSRVAFDDTTGRMIVMQTHRIPLEGRVVGSGSADAITTRLGEVVQGVLEVILNGELYGDDDGVTNVELEEISDFTLGTPQGYLGQCLFTLAILTQST
jgi:hypothetical protein